MNNPIDSAVKELLNQSLAKIEKVLDSDVLCYFGPIIDGNENFILQIVEDLAQDPNKKRATRHCINYHWRQCHGGGEVCEHRPTFL